MSTLVIVPAYNEEKSIVSTIEELRRVAPEFSYVIIDDGSSDGTSSLCQEHDFNLVSHPVNLGLTGAFQTGMKYAYRHGFDHALQFDADGQHMPHHIAALVSKMEQSGADIVIGSRFVTESKPFSLRMAGSNLISWLIRFTTGTMIHDPTSGMRLYDRRMIKEFATRLDLSPEPDTLAYLIRKRGAVVQECQVSMRDRVAGESYLTLHRSIEYMLNAVSSILFAQWFRR